MASPTSGTNSSRQRYCLKMVLLFSQIWLQEHQHEDGEVFRFFYFQISFLNCCGLHKTQRWYSSIKTFTLQLTQPLIKKICKYLHMICISLHVQCRCKCLSIVHLISITGGDFLTPGNGTWFVFLSANHLMSISGMAGFLRQRPRGRCGFFKQHMGNCGPSNLLEERTSNMQILQWPAQTGQHDPNRRFLRWIK